MLGEHSTQPGVSTARPVHEHGISGKFYATCAPSTQTERRAPSSQGPFQLPVELDDVPSPPPCPDVGTPPGKAAEECELVLPGGTARLTTAAIGK